MVTAAQKFGVKSCMKRAVADPTPMDKTWIDVSREEQERVGGEKVAPATRDKGSGKSRAEAASWLPDPRYLVQGNESSNAAQRRWYRCVGVRTQLNSHGPRLKLQQATWLAVLVPDRAIPTHAYDRNWGFNAGGSGALEMSPVHAVIAASGRAPAVPKGWKQWFLLWLTRQRGQLGRSVPVNFVDQSVVST